MLLFPLTALALDWIFRTARDLHRGKAPASWKREAAVAASLTAVIFTLAPALAWTGARLRESHRFAVHECSIAGQPRFCYWRTVGRVGSLHGASGVKGVWNGVGIALPAAHPGKSGAIAAETELALPPGDYAIEAEVDLTGSRPTEDSQGTMSFIANERPLSPALSLSDLPDGPSGAPALVWKTNLHHAGGPLSLRLAITTTTTVAQGSPGRVWLSNLRVRPTSQPLPVEKQTTPKESGESASPIPKR